MSRDRGEPVWLENFGEKIDCGRCGRDCQNIAASAISIPILMGKKFWGALEFSSHNRRQVDPATIACLNGIGSQIANRVERELAQQRLLESEKRYRVIFNHAGIGVTGASLDGKLCQMNPAFLNMLGYDEQELQGRSFEEITHPDDLLREKQFVGELIRGERSNYVMQKRYIRKSGTPLWVQVTVTAVNEEPKLFFIAVVENIDEQRSAQEQLRRSEARYRLMVEGSEQVYFYEHDAAHRFTYVSPSVRNVLGYEPDEMLGRRYDDFVGDDVSREVVTECTDSAMVNGERGPSYTVTAPHKSGYPVNIELTEAPVHNEHDESVMLGFARDVTVRTLTEERLLLSDQILNAVDSIVLVADAAGKIIYSNPFATKVLGYPTEQILGFGWWALISPGLESPLEKCQRIARQASGETSDSDGTP